MSLSFGHRLVPGSVIGGDFTVERPLDEGGMGAVFVVAQRSTGKLRALKVMHREIVADAALARRFEQEARVGARIASDHVVEVIAAGFDASIGLPYLVMELLEGETLRHRMDTRGAMAPAEVQAIFEQLCHAVAAAHAAGVVHRDLKPENVFLASSRRAGATPFTVKVLDFGIAKLLAEVQTHATRGTLGSPLWMAAEQTASGDIAPAADVWALGLIAYHLLTGGYYWRTARGGTSVQLLREIVFESLPRASERAREDGVAERLPPGFDPWFARCVTREMASRFPNARTMWDAMQSVFAGSGESVDATMAPRPVLVAAPRIDPALAPTETPIASVQEARAARPPPRARAVPFAAGVVVAVAALGGGYLLATKPKPAAPPPTPVAVSAPTPAPPPPPPAPAPASASATASASAAPPPVASAIASSAPTAPPRKPKKQLSASGFGDPADRNAAVLWKVQDRRVRLFTRMIRNDTNVIDKEVREAVDHTSWLYLRCYERHFQSAKILPEGDVTVSFEILDQLPRHGKLESSTFESVAFSTCVVDVLLGQTANGAGPDGKGHVLYAFRFVPMDKPPVE
ncbi:serine/threonine protein kinase [Pendulispora rubella]|uniref:Serine/threonine protein kinase n=1 Tax=Pendulispora rubella TaxID=2741070 RepID=A0ABZ2LK99_9BACT